MNDLQISYSTYLSNLCEALYAQHYVARGLVFCRTVRWRTGAEVLPAASFGTILGFEEEGSGYTALIDIDGVLCLAWLTDGYFSMRMASGAPVPESMVERFKALLPALEHQEEQVVDVRFWRAGSDGCARCSSRTIDVPNWSEVGANYPASTREMLTPLFEGFRPGESGQLLLWHGPPGTGKTFALRALAWEWREWCNVEYVIDPDRLLRDSDYLVSVVTDDDEDEDDEDGWRLLVLEDTGELLIPDAKAQVGQGLSRLLNLVDGILGQGLRLMILVTTNEPLSALHPAVSRPGRCAAEIYFAPFTGTEAKEWAKRSGRISPAGGGTLAELFDSGTQPARSTPARRAIGF